MSVQPLAGYLLGQYQVQELPGAGSMGAVYRGYQLNLKREVAIKILATGFAAQAEYRERFTREAEIVARLEHAHIVPIYDFGIQDMMPYIVMRLLSGGTLYARMEQQLIHEKRLASIVEVCTLLKQLASALSYAHSQGIVHRDVKPEQWRSERVGPATDQYALAVLTYTYLTGRLPFEAPTPHGLMYKHLSELPTPPHQLHEAIPRAISQVLQRALAKNPAHRFNTVTDFAEAFERATSEQTQNLGVITRFDPVPAPNMATAIFAPAPAINALNVHATQPLIEKPRIRLTRRRGMAMFGAFALLTLAFMFAVTRGDSHNANASIDGAAVQTSTPEPFAVLDATGTVTSTPTETATSTATETETETETATPTITLTIIASRTTQATVRVSPTSGIVSTRIRPPATQRPAPTSVPTSVLPTAPPIVPPNPPVKLPGGGLPKLP